MYKPKIPLGMKYIVATDFNPLNEKTASYESSVGTACINNA
ncbi:hypothetical protein [Flavobacterium crocinum]|nr:hypothetical protein [Flavobacterium crocinum]